MQFSPHPARRLRWTLALMTPAVALTACAHQPVAILSASPCSQLVPDDWKDGVDSAPLPPKPATVGDWIAFGDAQTGQLEKANGRTVDTLTIVGKCEARDREAADRLAPKPWWKFWG